MSESPAAPPTWHLFNGQGKPHDGIKRLPVPPRWRRYDGEAMPERALAPATIRARFEIEDHEVDLVNAALFLRRPLLVTGKPGTGKTTLARAVAHELELGEVLEWPINTRSTLQEGLYRYDAIGRMQDHNLESDAERSAEPADIGRYIKLGPLGTALLPGRRPRVLLIDEIDKSDIDLPNDLLHVFEEGRYEIPELSRLDTGGEPVNVRPFDGDEAIPIARGRVQCHAFPFVVLTSNGERDFPPPFLRRCIRLEIEPPKAEKLARIVRSHFKDPIAGELDLIASFIELREQKDLATDQLLNALYLTTQQHLDLDAAEREKLREALFRELV